MTPGKSETEAVKSAVLVYETKEGAVDHCFCTSDHANAVVCASKDANTGASAFLSEDGLEAEMVYSVSPDLRGRVEAAKAKLRFDIAVRNALNRHGVPAERGLRAAVYNVITELRETVLRPVC